MPERPPSRKVKIEEGTAEVKKGEKISSNLRASEMEVEDKKRDEKSVKQN